MADLDELQLLRTAATFTEAYPQGKEERLLAQTLVNSGFLAPVNSLKLTPEGWKRLQFLEERPDPNDGRHHGEGRC